MQSWVDLPCFDGVYTFKLGLAQIRELQRSCDGAGIGKIYSRTVSGRYGFGENDFHPELADFRIDELNEIIRLALVGGKHAVVDGVDVLITDRAATALVENYVKDGPDRMVLAQSWALAFQIMHSLMNGYEPPKKAEPDPAPAPKTKTKASTTRRRSPTPR